MATENEDTGFSFWNFRMPDANNGIQGAKAAIERGDPEWADLCLDSTMKGLEKARKETTEAMAKRDRGESRANDPDVQNGINY